MGAEDFNFAMDEADEEFFSSLAGVADNAPPLQMSTSVPSTFLPSYYPTSRDPDFSSFPSSTTGSGSGSGPSSTVHGHSHSFHALSQFHPLSSTSVRPGDSPTNIERLSAAGPSTRHLLDGIDMPNPPRPPQPSASTSLSTSWQYGGSLSPFSAFDTGGSGTGAVASGTGHSSASSNAPATSDPWEGLFAMDLPSPAGVLGMTYQPHTGTGGDFSANLIPSPQPARLSTSLSPHPPFSSSSSMSPFHSSGQLSAQLTGQNLPANPHRSLSTSASPFHAPIKIPTPPGPRPSSSAPMRPMQSAPAGPTGYHDPLSLQDPQPSSINYPLSLFGNVPLPESDQMWTGMGMPQQQRLTGGTVGDEYAQVSERFRRVYSTSRSPQSSHEIIPFENPG